MKDRERETLGKGTNCTRERERERETERETERERERERELIRGFRDAVQMPYHRDVHGGFQISENAVFALMLLLTSAYSSAEAAA